MFFVSDIFRTPPKSYKSKLQQLTYETLERLDIPFERVDTDEAISMQDCVEIDRKLDMKTVKTLFLCNREKTKFYLFITMADKPFRSRDFGRALHIPRASFASEEFMQEKMGFSIGGATVFGLLMDKDNDVKVVIDKDVIDQKWYGCTDGTATGYMKVRTDQIINIFIPYTKHEPEVIEV